MIKRRTFLGHSAIAASGYDTEKEHIGVIAQELQEIAPYMIENFEKTHSYIIKGISILA